MRRRDDLTGELNDIYQLLSGDAKKNFRSGIAIALSRLPSAFSSESIARRFLHLAGRVHATEILPIAVQQIGNGFFGIPDNDWGRELFALTLDIVGGMSPAAGVEAALHRLIASSFFQPGYAPKAFIALCRANPEGYADHLDLLRKCFIKLHQAAGLTDSYLTARRFVQYVDVELIARNFCGLFISGKPSHEPDNDDWLVEALFVGDTAPLLLRKHNGFFTISRTDKHEYLDSYKITMNRSLLKYNDLMDVKIFLNRCLERNRERKWQYLKYDVGKMRDLPSFYRPDEFKEECFVRALCNVLEKDALTTSCNDVDDINNLLKIPNLYTKIIEARKPFLSEMNVTSLELLHQYQLYSIEQRNRIAVEAAYSESPKNNKVFSVLGGLQLLGSLYHQSPLSRPIKQCLAR